MKLLIPRGLCHYKHRVNVAVSRVMLFYPVLTAIHRHAWWHSPQLTVACIVIEHEGNRQGILISPSFYVSFLCIPKFNSLDNLSSFFRITSSHRNHKFAQHVLCLGQQFKLNLKVFEKNTWQFDNISEIVARLFFVFNGRVIYLFHLFHVIYFHKKKYYCSVTINNQLTQYLKPQAIVFI